MRWGGRTRLAEALQSALCIAAVVLLSLAPVQLARADALAFAQPPNVGDAKIAATEYYQSGAYERDIAAVTAAARA